MRAYVQKDIGKYMLIHALHVGPTRQWAFQDSTGVAYSRVYITLGNRAVTVGYGNRKITVTSLNLN